MSCKNSEAFNLSPWGKTRSQSPHNPANCDEGSLAIIKFVNHLHSQQLQNYQFHSSQVHKTEICEPKNTNKKSMRKGFKKSDKSKMKLKHAIQCKNVQRKLDLQKLYSARTEANETMALFQDQVALGSCDKSAQLSARPALVSINWKKELLHAPYAPPIKNVFECSASYETNRTSKPLVSVCLNNRTRSIKNEVGESKCGKKKVPVLMLDGNAKNKQNVVSDTAKNINRKKTIEKILIPKKNSEIKIYRALCQSSRTMNTLLQGNIAHYQQNKMNTITIDKLYSDRMRSRAKV